MAESIHRAIISGRPFIYLFLLFQLGAGSAFAQRLYSVSVESVTVRDGRKSVLNKDIFYRRDGNLNIRYAPVGSREYYSTTSAFGFTTVYYPSTNESVTLAPEMFTADDELLYLFATGAGEDLGMARFGFALKSTRKDGDFTVRRYEPREKSGTCAWVELVFGKDWLPVYCAYYDRKGRVLTKTYLSDYSSQRGFFFPGRVTEVTFLMEKKDSTVRRDIYSGLKLDVPDEMFDFHVPSGAKPVDLQEGLKSLSKSAR